MRKKILVMLLMSVMILQACSKDIQTPTKIDTESEQSTEITLESVSIEVIDDKTIKVLAEAVGENLEYAYYIYKDGEILEKIMYEKSANELEYKVNEEGLYKVRVFVMNVEGEKETKYTEEVEIEGAF